MSFNRLLVDQPRPEIAGSAVLVGDVHVGAGAILANTVLHLLPDNELVIEDDVVVGPGAMIHGCHIGCGSVIEPAAIVWRLELRGSRVGGPRRCVRQAA